MAEPGTKDGTGSEGIVESVIEGFKDLVGIGDDGEEGGDAPDPATANALTGADPTAGLDAPVFAGSGRGPGMRGPGPAADGPTQASSPPPTIEADVDVGGSIGDPLDPDGGSVGGEGDIEVTIQPHGDPMPDGDIEGEGDVGFTLPAGRWGSAHVDVDEDGVEITNPEGDLGLGDLGIEKPEDYDDSGRVWADDEGLHGRYEFGNPNAEEGQPSYSGWAEGDLTEDGFRGAGHAEAGYEGDVAGVPVDASAEVDATATVGPDGAQLDATGSGRVDTPYGTIGEAEGELHGTLDGTGLELGARGSGTAHTWMGDVHGEAEGDLAFGQGALDAAGRAELSVEDPLGVSTSTYEAEGQGHVDDAGWDAEGDIGYELDVGGGGPDINVGAGFHTSGEFSDVEDAAHDAGDAVQDTYDSAEDTANDVADDVANSDANPGNWF
jgi:hypothetical protein